MYLNKEVEIVTTRKYVVTSTLKTKDLKIENTFGKQYHLKIVYRHYLNCLNKKCLISFSYKPSALFSTIICEDMHTCRFFHDPDMCLSAHVRCRSIQEKAHAPKAGQQVCLRKKIVKLLFDV